MLFIAISDLKFQLDTYREDFYAEKKARQKMKVRNKELENQLEQAKIKLEQQQKKVSIINTCNFNPI